MSILWDNRYKWFKTKNFVNIVFSYLKRDYTEMKEIAPLEEYSILEWDWFVRSQTGSHKGIPL